VALVCCMPLRLKEEVNDLSEAKCSQASVQMKLIYVGLSASLHSYETKAVIMHSIIRLLDLQAVIMAVKGCIEIWETVAKGIY